MHPDPELQPEFYSDLPLKRFIAWGVDSIVLLALTAIIVLFTLFTALFALPAVFITLNVAYRTVTIARNGATPGMQLMAIELRDARGQLADPLYAFLHTLGYVVASVLVLPQIVSVALMLMTQRRQGLHDFLLGTVVINRAAPL